MFAVAAAIWVQTRSGKALAACLVVIIFTLAWLLMQLLVVTEPEQIKRAVQEIAAELEENDAEGVVGYISATNPDLAEEVRMTLSAVDVDKVTIKRNFQATVTTQNGYTNGEARFNAVATVKDRRGLWGPQPVPRFVILRMRKEDKTWKVRGYELQDPRKGLGQ